ncbi:MAG: hydroxyphenylacetyl-CoA thioesterase PaaI [Alphaproteobacteria bacterium]|nr:hydroxyphenylacetyl-CoA thioesterase PaaI [Alphaproteobacteria bacterium]MBV9692759.1 hydroxyphenylacetyl-CoA thioesterase PaaI [Alphaproteobacteria bacterium]
MSDADELARRVAETLRAREGTGPALGIGLEDAREGYARVAMIVRKDMLNGKNMAHGGMIFTLADTAFAYACNCRNANTVAQSASISFLAPGREGDRLQAEAREVSLAGRSGVYQVTVSNQHGETVAVFQGHSRTIGGAILPEA